MRNYYSRLFEGRAYGFADRQRKQFFELTEFLTDVLRVEDLGARFEAVASFHDACGALRECRIGKAPRRLLSNVRGLELRETDDCEVCCGFGGTFSVKFEPISLGMAEQKVQNALDAGVKYIISTDLSCLFHLDGYIRKMGLPIKTIHIADVLASGWS